jgi:type VI secretion system protein ImpC
MMATAEKQSQQSAAAAQAEEQEGLLGQIISATKVERSEAERLIETLAKEALSGQLTFDKTVTKTITERIKSIDKLLSEQLAAILHHEDFQKIEGAWRGLHYLVANAPLAPDIKIRVLPTSQREVLKDLESALEFDQSQLWKKLYEAEFGTAGGQPYGAIIGDFEFKNHPDDLTLLGEMSKVCAGAFAPFISAASPAMFGFEGWTDLTKPTDLSMIYENVKYAKWKSFRDSPDSRFVTLTMPRTLARMPYGANTRPIDEFHFEELPLGRKGESIKVDHNQYCWMNTAYVLGARLIDAFDKTGFCTAIRGKQNGGLVEGLPAHIFETDEGDTDLKCPTEIGITDRREKELSDLGFLPLVHYKNTDYAVFFGGQTTQKPKSYYGKDAMDANANARISARLPYIMASSRLAHYLKCYGRDWIGSFKEKEDMQKHLEQWVSQYVSADENPSESARARYPLREARIEVQEVPGEPGCYNAVCFMRPWLQMEELTAALSMVARIPGQAGG